MANLVSGEARGNEKMASYIRQRERAREEIVRLEIEYEDLAKHIL